MTVPYKKNSSERISALVKGRNNGGLDYGHRTELSNLLSVRVKHIRNLIKLPDTVLVDPEDMLSVGILAAYTAMGRWDPGRADFMTFAFGRIRGAMFDYLRRIDRLPRPIRVRLAQIHKSSARVEQSYGSAYIEEVSLDTGISVDNIRSALTMSQSRFHLCLFDSINPDADDNQTVIGTIPVDDDKLRLLAKDLDAAIGKLPSREQRIMRDFYMRDIPQCDIAIRNNLTEARISQIRHACLDKLRAELADGFALCERS